MPRPFFQATAEQVISATEAVASLGKVSADQVAAFTDLPDATATSALRLSVDLGLLAEADGTFSSASPLCRLLRTPHEKEKAAILRATIEGYEPFLVFREEHDATSNVTIAAQRTKAKLDLTSHREEVKATLLSLATYTGALTAAGQGNSYERDAHGLTLLLEELAAGVREEAEAALTVQKELGPAAGHVNYDEVVRPLAAALRHAAASNGREAVLQGGIAVENFLAGLGVVLDVNMNGAHGINAKMGRLVQASHFPAKIEMASKYVGHLRNAADHGSDDDIGAPWQISAETGRNYVFVAIMLVRAMHNHQQGQHEL